MPLSELNNVYLPFMRDLTYQTHYHMNGQLVETQSGIIMPATAQTLPISKIFYADNVDITVSELQLLQNFYQKYYLQKFRFKDPQESYKKLSIVEIPNGVINQFTLNNEYPDLLYFLHSAKIYNHLQLLSDIMIDTDLQFIIMPPPITGSIITAIIDYDYAVMFDYDYGLQSIFDSKTKTYKISFRLI